MILVVTVLSGESGVAMSIRVEVERNISELGEIVDAAEKKYRQSLETEDDYAALELLEAAVDLVPDFGDAWHALGVRYMGLHLVDKAEKCFVESWRHHVCVDTFLCLAEISLKKERYSWARMFYGYVLRVEPANLRALLGQVDVFRSEEKLLKALCGYEDVLELIRLKDQDADIGDWLAKRGSGLNLCLVDEYCNYRDIE